MGPLSPPSKICEWIEELEAHPQRRRPEVRDALRQANADLRWSLGLRPDGRGPRKDDPTTRLLEHANSKTDLEVALCWVDLVERFHLRELDLMPPGWRSRRPKSRSQSICDDAREAVRADPSVTTHVAEGVRRWKAVVEARRAE